MNNCYDFVRAAAERVKSAFVRGVVSGDIGDVAFIGNASDLYVWVPSRIVDLDVTVFAPRLNRELGLWLLSIRERLHEEVAVDGIDFELRIIRGPYKATPRLSRPVLVAHVSLFTDEDYVKERALLRWAWRKYPCIAEPARLVRLAPEQPTLEELLDGKGGVNEKLNIIQSGTAPMTESLLPDLKEFCWIVSAGEPLFAEFCLAGTATCARNHGRALGRPEADCLGNGDFAIWYDRTVMKSAELQQVMALKAKVRNNGYEDVLALAPELAIRYLRRLQTALGSAVTREKTISS